MNLGCGSGSVKRHVLIYLMTGDIMRISGRYCPPIVAAVAFALASAADPYESLRERMVTEQIEARGIHTPAVLVAMRTVPRHLFVAPALAWQAYSDHPLPIGGGQTISQPAVVALMTDLLDVQRPDHVLEIGTGSGYQAAVLSLLAAKVYTIEIIPSLGQEAAKRLQTLGYANVEVRIGNGYAGWRERAPFDKIVLTAAPPEVPQALIDQLKAGGKLVAPVGPSIGTQELIVLDKSRSGRISQRRVIPVAFVPMVKE